MIRKLSGFSCGARIPLLVVLGAAVSLGAWTQAGQQPPQPATAVIKAAAEAAGGGVLGKIDGLELNTRRIAFLSGKNQGQSEADVRLIYPAQMRVEIKVLESQTMGGSGSSGLPAPGAGGGPGGGPITPMSTSEHTVFALREGCDGTVWWRKTPVSIEEHPMAKSTQLRIELVGALGLYRRAAEGQLQGKLLGEQPVQGHQVQVVALDEGNAKIFIDPQTHLLVGAAFTGTAGEETFDAFHWWSDFVKISLQAAGREQTVWWSDYRRVKFKVEGKEEVVQFPYLWTSYIEGTKFLEEKITGLKLNPKQNPKIFAKPK